MDLFEQHKPHPKLSELQQQLDALLHACSQLKDENRSLRAQQSQLISERASLIEKNEQARSRVEAMISRLKAMEEGQ